MDSNMKEYMDTVNKRLTQLNHTFDVINADILNDLIEKY